MRPAADVSTREEKPSRTVPSTSSERSRSCCAATRTPAARATASSRARSSASRRACSGVRPLPETEADTSTLRVSARAAVTTRQSDPARTKRTTLDRGRLAPIAGLLALPLLVGLHLAIQLLEGFRGAHPCMEPLLGADLVQEAGVGLADRHLHLDVGPVGAALAIELLLGQARAVEGVGDHGLA